ncbi:MAG: DNA mismatch repair endonuclease MutL [Brotaphodocola sp.]
MPQIQVLDQDTINKIAAGEVIERPASVVKELLENAIDAKATAITVEIREGGVSFIRVTDNGCGIPKEEIPLAFLRHTTSKIRMAEDLFTVSSLGFRGEALSSIAAVSQVEVITKTSDRLTGSRYQIEGGEERGLEEIGAPDGTTFISRNLFYNTPVRRKFLKTATTEGAHVADLVEKIALSHPDISIRFIQNNQNKLHTSGNHNLKDIIYTIYGREITSNLLPVEFQSETISIRGFIGKPVIARSNRNFENYFINGRYIRSGIICKAIEEAYKPFMMQHKYPFTMLHLSLEPEFLDVNVHPTKMELRFSDNEMVYRIVRDTIYNALMHKELIPEVSLDEKRQKEEERQIKRMNQEKRIPIPEPFEKIRRTQMEPEKPVVREEETLYQVKKEEIPQPMESESSVQETGVTEQKTIEPEQLELFSEKLLEPSARSRHKLIGQLFDTYWLVEFCDQLYIIDQHAAHEKVLYEKTLESLKTREYTTQMVSPPIILTLQSNEELLLKKHMHYFTDIGFEIEPFGGKEYAVRGVPANLFSIAKRELLMEMIDNLSDDSLISEPQIVLEKIASMSCKAAVKGNHHMSSMEADQLIDQLLGLENPYACPHGRPTIISMSKYELEKKFKRIV